MTQDMRKRGAQASAPLAGQGRVAAGPVAGLGRLECKAVAAEAYGLEQKFCRFDEGVVVTDGCEIEGYASLFGQPDQGGDVVAPGAYGASLKRLAASDRKVKLLWQHDPAQPIGVWDALYEDSKGLYVKGRLLTEIEKGREAARLIEAGALDGLSIGYRTVKASRDGAGHRVLDEVDLWEVSLVTFPMLPEARLGAKAEESGADGALREMAGLIEEARTLLAGPGPARPTTIEGQTS